MGPRGAKGSAGEGNMEGGVKRLRSAGSCLQKLVTDGVGKLAAGQREGPP